MQQQPPSGVSKWRTWAFAGVPFLGLLELGAHVVQTQSVVPTADWQAARTYVLSHSTADDLVAFAPRWVDPIGRQEFGPGLATIPREARADESRFPRAFEVTIRGAHLAPLAGWKRGAEQQFGKVTVTTWENPAPVHVLDDLVSDFYSARMRVFHVEGGQEEPCFAENLRAETGGLGFGTPVPSDRFVCKSGGFVGISIMEDANYYPRRCIDAPPLGGHSILRMHFIATHFGRTLRGHHSLYVEAEHSLKAPVNMTFTVDGTVIGRVVHRDLEGWKPFEFDTSDRAGTVGTLQADIESSTNERRMYCFEAVTE